MQRCLKAYLGTQSRRDFSLYRRSARRSVLPLHFRRGICAATAGRAQAIAAALGWLQLQLAALRQGKGARRGAPLKSQAACTAGAGASAPPYHWKEGLSAARGFALACAAAAGAMPAAATGRGAAAPEGRSFGAK